MPPPRASFQSADRFGSDHQQRSQIWIFLIFWLGGPVLYNFPTALSSKRISTCNRQLYSHSGHGAATLSSDWRLFKVSRVLAKARAPHDDRSSYFTHKHLNYKHERQTRNQKKIDTHTHTHKCMQNAPRGTLDGPRASHCCCCYSLSIKNNNNNNNLPGLAYFLFIFLFLVLFLWWKKKKNNPKKYCV